MATYFRTAKFSAEPADFFDEMNIRHLYGLGEEVCIRNVRFREFNIILSYVVPDGLQDSPDDTLPSVCRMIKALPGILSHNKAVIDYDEEEGRLYVVLAEGKNKLLLVNSYAAHDFATAFYYLNLAVSQSMLNPQLTAVYGVGKLKPENVKMVERYFQKFAYL